MKNDKIDIESLKREGIHKVPDGYFDELPLKIQSRINEDSQVSSPLFIPRMQIAWRLTAAALILLIGWFYYPQGEKSMGVDEMLSDVQSEDLVAYLFEENMNTEEILAMIDEEFILEEIEIDGSQIINESLSNDDLESIYSELDYSTEIM